MARVTYKTRNKALVVDCNQGEIPENVKFFYRVADVNKVEKAMIIIENEDGVRHVLSFARFD